MYPTTHVICTNIKSGVFSGLHSWILYLVVIATSIYKMSIIFDLIINNVKHDSRGIVSICH